MSKPLFVSSVEGRIVHKFGSRIPIGVSDTNGKIAWDTQAITMITPADVERYGAAYAKHIRAGDLVERTQEEFDAFKAQAEKAEAATDTKATKAGKKES